jgi:hypothetical protein
VANGIITPPTATALLDICGRGSIPPNGLVFKIDTPDALSFTPFFSMSRKNLCLIAEIDSRPKDPNAYEIPDYTVTVEDSQGHLVQTGVTLQTGRRQSAQWFHIGPGRRRFAIVPNRIHWDPQKQPIHPSLVGTLTATESDDWPACR